MRVHILSDLHQEFGEVDVPDVACDCVILAGDVDSGVMQAFAPQHGT